MTSICHFVGHFSSYNDLFFMFSRVVISLSDMKIKFAILFMAFFLFSCNSPQNQNSNNPNSGTSNKYPHSISNGYSYNDSIKMAENIKRLEQYNEEIRRLKILNAYNSQQSKKNRYSYDVSGYDEDGNYFSGSVDVTDRGGDGYVTDDDGNERYIEADWTGKGELEGYDEDGIYYELEVD